MPLLAGGGRICSIPRSRYSCRGLAAHRRGGPARQRLVARWQELTAPSVTPGNSSGTPAEEPRAGMRQSRARTLDVTNMLPVVLREETTNSRLSEVQARPICRPVRVSCRGWPTDTLPFSDKRYTSPLIGCTSLSNATSSTVRRDGGHFLTNACLRGCGDFATLPVGHGNHEYAETLRGGRPVAEG